MSILESVAVHEKLRCFDNSGTLTSGCAKLTLTDTVITNVVTGTLLYGHPANA